MSVKFSIKPSCNACLYNSVWWFWVHVASWLCHSTRTELITVGLIKILYAVHLFVCLKFSLNIPFKIKASKAESATFLESLKWNTQSGQPLIFQSARQPTHMHGPLHVNLWSVVEYEVAWSRGFCYIQSKTCYSCVFSGVRFFWHSPIHNQRGFLFSLPLPIISCFLSFNYVVVTSLCTWQPL